MIVGPAYAMNGFTTTNEIDYTFTGDNTVSATGYTGLSTEITVPATVTDGTNSSSDVTTIGAKPFWRKSLAPLTLQEGLETIGSEAVSDNKLSRIEIPASVAAIGLDAFGASSLTSAIFAGAAPTTFTQNSHCYRDPVWWTPRKKECSSWGANVGSPLLSTRTRP